MTTEQLEAPSDMKGFIFNRIAEFSSTRLMLSSYHFQHPPRTNTLTQAQDANQTHARAGDYLSSTPSVFFSALIHSLYSLPLSSLALPSPLWLSPPLSGPPPDNLLNKNRKQWFVCSDFVPMVLFLNICYLFIYQQMYDFKTDQCLNFKSKM